MDALWVILAIGWLPAIPAALAYFLIGRRVWPAALGLLALGALGWAVSQLGARDAGLGMMGIALLGTPGVLAAAIVPDFAEEETVAGFVYFGVSTVLVLFYLFIRSDGTF